MRLITKTKILGWAMATTLLVSPAFADNVFMLNFGSYQTKEEAEKHLTELTDKHVGALSRLNAGVRSVKLPPDNLTVYRTQAGPLATRADAQSVCSQLASNGDECYVVETVMATTSKPVPEPTKPAKSAKAMPVVVMPAKAPKEADALPPSNLPESEPTVAATARDPKNIAVLRNESGNAPLAPSDVKPPPESADEAEKAVRAALEEAAKKQDQTGELVQAPSAPKGRSIWERLNPFSDTPESPEKTAESTAAAAAAAAMAAPVESVATTPMPPPLEPLRPLSGTPKVITINPPAEPAPVMAAKKTPPTITPTPEPTREVEVAPLKATEPEPATEPKPDPEPTIEAKAELPTKAPEAVPAPPVAPSAPAPTLIIPEMREKPLPSASMLTSDTPPPMPLGTIPAVTESAGAPYPLPPPPLPLATRTPSAPVATQTAVAPAPTPVESKPLPPLVNPNRQPAPAAIVATPAQMPPPPVNSAPVPPAPAQVLANERNLRPAPLPAPHAPVPVAAVPAMPSVDLSPSATIGQQTLWAEIGPFAAAPNALAFWQNYRQTHPDFPVVRVRVTSPVAKASGDAMPVSLRVGPFKRPEFIRNLCHSLPAQAAMHCGVVADLGVAVNPYSPPQPGILQPSRYSR